MLQAFSLNGSVADLLRVVVLAGVYFATAKLSLLAAIPPGYATALWPPSGIAFAAVLLLGPRVWPGIWLGAALVNITVQASLMAAVIIGTGNTLEALAGAALVRRQLGVQREFKRGWDVSQFIGIAILSAAIAATFAAIPLSLVHALDWRDLAWNWWTWWLGDTMGIILVTPLILSWRLHRQRKWSTRRIVEITCLTAGLLLTSQLIFSDIASPFVPTLPLAFLVLPFIIWAAIRYRQREVTTLIAFASAIAIIFTAKGRGPFATDSLNVSLSLLLAFMSTIAATGLVLNAVVWERARKMATLNEVLRKVREQAITDPLTGLYNRRFLEDYLPRELARAARGELPVAVIMLDLDHFKRVNDKSGHAAGDAVLVAIGTLLRRHVRASDVACRYGGEEFLLVMPETALVAARRKAELIRIDVERDHDSLLGVTASLGVAIFPDHGADATALIRSADSAMYDAKQAGRNRVAVRLARSPD